MRSMPNPEFIELVAQMRAAQRNYFATRDGAVLKRSKELERQVDDYIAQVKQKAEQLSLSIEGELLR